MSLAAENVLYKDGVKKPSHEAFKLIFQAIARYFNRPTSPVVLFSGVFYGKDPAVGFSQIERVSDRVGLKVTATKPRDFKQGRIECPAIIQVKSGEFIGLISKDRKGAFNVVIGDTGEEATLTLETILKLGLKSCYSFAANYSNSHQRADLRGPREIERSHWFFGTLRLFWRGYIYVALATLFVNSLGLATPLFIMNVYDRILPNKATSSLIALAVGVGLALLFDFLLKVARGKIIDQTGRALDQKISTHVFDKVLYSSLSSRPASTGEYANRVSQLEFVREFFASNTISTIIDALFVFIFLLVIYYIADWLFVIPLIAFVISILVGLVAQYRIGVRVARAANEVAERQALLVETISTLETVKALRGEAPLIHKWSQLTQRGSKTTTEIKQISSNAANTTQFVQQAVSVAIVIAGAYQFSLGAISTGAIIATVMLAGRTVAPLSQITLTLARFRQAMLSLKILNEVMKQPEDRPNNAGFVNRDINNGSFAFKDVSFRYPGSDSDVIQKLSFSAQPGERIGIIGKIGSGKTTVGRLLANLYEAQDGRILIDGIDVRQYHSASVREAVAFSSQSTDLFSGTLKENLQISNPDATDEELIQAAKKTGVDDFASRHQRGYDMPVGERGNELSGGQRQAVAMARILLSKPKIIFLDEPSGAMDLATERQLMTTLANAFEKDVTLVISTHRHSLLDLIDRLIVLDNGRVLADGPKDKVLQALAAKANSARMAEKT